ncbi:MAG: SoxR reducing system RseC family protein [Bacteroidaceae bacterium]|nr:SoxR reducing system RseC family protein [Bacteroidaceae bacterium]
MADVIKHDGIVDSIEGDCIHVRIVQASACAACGAKSLCSAAESKEKIVEVYDADVNAYQVGQRVMVEGAASMGMKAVRLAFLYPLVLMVAAVAVAMGLTDGNEAMGAVAALLTLAAYFAVLFACKKRLMSEFRFTISAGVQKSGVQELQTIV